MLAHWPEHPNVALVTTDGFLYPNAELERRGLLQRKGFPESYDRRALLRFVVDIKSGKDEVEAPTYSHLIYDVVPDETVVIKRPDIVIIEGLNVLQPARVREDGRAGLTLSDFFDFSVYVDAGTAPHPGLVRRAVPAAARDGVPRPATSYFSQYAALSARRGDRGGEPDLGHDQRPQPGAEHAADPLPRHAGAAQGPRPLGPLRAAAEDLSPDYSAFSTSRQRSTTRNPSRSLIAFMCALTSALPVMMNASSGNRSCERLLVGDLDGQAEPVAAVGGDDERAALEAAVRHRLVDEQLGHRGDVAVRCSGRRW